GAGRWRADAAAAPTLSPTSSLPDRFGQPRSTRRCAASGPPAAPVPRAATPPRRRGVIGTRAAPSRSFPRKRESRGHIPWLWVPAFAGTNGVAARGGSFDHLVGEQLHRIRDGNAEHWRPSEIDDQLTLGPLRHR